MNAEILGIRAPAQVCTDKKCPFHGEIMVKKELFTGKVVKRDVNRSATIEWYDSCLIPKYERYEIRRRRLHVHNPSCLDARIGDEVVVVRTRPLSKTKHHVIIQKISPQKKNTMKQKITAKKSVKKKVEESKEAKK